MRTFHILQVYEKNRIMKEWTQYLGNIFSYKCYWKFMLFFHKWLVKRVKINFYFKAYIKINSAAIELNHHNIPQTVVPPSSTLQAFPSSSSSSSSWPIHTPLTTTKWNVYHFCLLMRYFTTVNEQYTCIIVIINLQGDKNNTT